ncbi:ferredoxin--NADP+ reductase [Angomonas deanei]|uniref:NADPH:adrenodoxin oxidoreductase, mitochondrial n=1 Tax=Angomonas deanei TaxID=59799 RepID=A0A7G2CLZ6_9TRYP|nr:ferredoxin--NADP+ reductase [Angomonas deanei]CAD2220860.1 Pyridine nucleotide-disulphide oxidoreductase/NAD(P)-binding Rossmann-like domain containing protein, putative [Angomonas deanei]|eukprot:EPY39888.1 ferredoxin--NADP+ reductase [Angomonas deanei]
MQIAVVGSGPSGCFIANYLTKKNPNVHVDIYERLPVPFGLCRYGVAPDHPDVKNVENQFMEMFQSGRVTWIGNITVGKEIPVNELLNHYGAVVLSTGAEGSKNLNIEGEDLGNVLSARDFVNYYNTFPFPYGSPRFCPFDISKVKKATIIGNGNVAMDVARVLAADYKYFCPTDMNAAAVKEFMKNRITEVNVVGRRGPEHSAFAIAEFREITKYQPETVTVGVDPFDLAKCTAVLGAGRNSRAQTRLMELVHQFAISPEQMQEELRQYASTAAGEPLQTAASTATGLSPASTSQVRPPCSVRFRYHLKPIKFIPNPHRKNYVGGVLYERTDVSPDAPESERYVVEPCDVVLKSVGYRSDLVKGVPFDEQRGIIPNEKGRVEGCPRLYCSGWVKNGAKGVILHSVVDAQETVQSIVEDLEQHVIPSEAAEEGKEGPTMFGKYGLVDYFVAKKLEPVSVSGLNRIFHTEKERGVDLGKRLEKVDNVRDMLDIALGGEVGKKVHDRVRGITPSRPEAMLYLKELLDDDTDLAPLAKELAREVPHTLAERHPTGRLSPSQL